MGRGLRAFADASLVIDVLEGTPRGLRFSAELTRTDLDWCYSPLVRMECRVRSLANNDQQALALLETILSTMTRLDLTDEVFERAAELRAKTSLKTPDALHVATALIHGCAELWTADVRLGRAIAPGLAVRVVT